MAAADAGARPLVGWRAWKIAWHALVFENGLWRMTDDAGPCLASWLREYMWPRYRAARASDWSEGICRTEATGHPSRKCKCGIYAYASKAHLLQALFRETGDDECFAYGRVSLWGNWVRGEKGWRAEFGYPFDIKVVNTDEKLARVLADAYAIDVTYGLWPSQEGIDYDCETDGHHYVRGSCSFCGVAQHDVERAEYVSTVKRLGLDIPTFDTRAAALAWFKQTAAQLDAAGRASEIEGLRTLMLPVLALRLPDPESIVTPREPSPLQKVMERRPKR